MHAAIIAALMAGHRASSTWNPLDKNASMSLSGGNLVASINAAHGSVRGTRGRNAATADHYFELTISGFDDVYIGGIGNASATLGFFPGLDANGWSFYWHTGETFNNGANVAYKGSAGPSTVGVYLKAGVLKFYMAAGTTPGTAFSGLTGTMFPMWGPGSGSGGPRNMTINTGGTPFLYGLPGTAAPWQ